MSLDVKPLALPNCKKLGATGNFAAAAFLARPPGVRHYLGVAGPLEGLGAALRLMRERQGIRRQDMKARGGPPEGTIAKIETDSRPPDADTLGRFLTGLGATAHDLAYALDEVNGRGRAPIRPDAFFVDVIRREAMETPLVIGTLTGLAAAALRDANDLARERFVNSAAEAARQLARSVVDELERKPRA